MGICFAGTGLAELNIVLSPAYLHIGWVDHVLSLLGKLSVFNYNMKITGHTFLSLVGKVMEEQKEEVTAFFLHSWFNNSTGAGRHRCFDGTGWQS